MKRNIVFAVIFPMLAIGSAFAVSSVAAQGKEGLGPAPQALLATIERVSLANDGSQGNGHSGNASIHASPVSDSGRYVAFESGATNLVPGDTNSFIDIFVRDRQAGATERVSVSSSGAQANYHALQPSMSADGRYVAFVSDANNLVPGDTNTQEDIFVRDRQAGATERVSLNADGSQHTGFGAGLPAISGDGHYVAFEILATLTPDDLNGAKDVYLRDRQAGATILVSIGANSHSYDPSISDDGRYVAFHSLATNLVPGDTNNSEDVFVRDMQTLVIERVSLTANGSQANGNSYRASVSNDGRFVSFTTIATNMSPLDTDAAPDVYLWDRQTGATELVNVTAEGVRPPPGLGWSSDNSRISGDGRYVAFQSHLRLVPDDTNSLPDIYLRDRQTGDVEWITRNSASSNWTPDTSPDGRYLAFTSNSISLVPNDTNNANDLFLADRAAPATCTLQFTDVPEGSTFYPFVRCLACRGILGGYGDGTFRPNDPVTRGQLSKIVSNAAGFTENHTNQSFEDVPVGSTFHQFVERLFSRGHISGYACGGQGEACVPPGDRPYFRPNANVTRGQTSKIVASARGLPAPPPGQQTFQDVAQGSTFWTWIEALATSGSINGYACGNPEPCVPPENRPYFRPNANVTRGQSAKIVANTFYPGCDTP